MKSGDKDPLGAAAVLEPVYEAASDWPKLISVLEVQVAHADDPFTQVDLLHRIARLYEDALENHASAFDTYARALVARQRQRGDAPEPRAARDDREPLAATSPRSTTPSSTSSPRTRSASWSSVSAPRRSSRCSSRTSTTPSAATGASLEVDPENQTAVRSLDRLYLQTERWAELATILEREAEIGQTPDEILEFKYRLGQVQQHRLGNLDAAIAAYRDVLSAAPEHETTLEALEGLFAGGDQAGRDRARSSSRSTAPPASGRSSRASTRRSSRTP